MSAERLWETRAWAELVSTAGASENGVRLFGGCHEPPRAASLRCGAPNGGRRLQPVRPDRPKRRCTRPPPHRNPERGWALFGARCVASLDRGSATLFAILLPIVRKGLGWSHPPEFMTFSERRSEQETCPGIQNRLIWGCPCARVSAPWTMRTRIRFVTSGLRRVPPRGVGRTTTQRD
jgi:hypothetical protein